MNQAIVNGYNDASRLFKENKLDATLVLCQSLLKLSPANSAVLNLAGSALYRKQMFSEAESLLTIAVELAPQAEEIILNLARVLRKQKQPRRATSVLEQGLSGLPDSTRLLSALGEILYYNRRFDTAADIFERLLNLTPDNLDTLFRLACSYQECNRTEDAFDAYREILKRQPDHPEALVNLAQIYKSLGDHNKSQNLFLKSSQLTPNDPIFASRALFTMNYNFTKGDQFLKKAMHWAEKHADPHFPAMPPVLSTNPVRDRIGLGFISADFTHHPVGKLFMPVLERLNRDHFAVHCFSNVQIEDGMTKRFRSMSPNFHEIQTLDDAAACDLIQGIGIDVLVDLSGHSNHNRLGVLARKPTPIQITWLGYFNTTGMKAMDYVLADPITIPADQEQYYRERILRLKDSFFPFVPHSMPHSLSVRNTPVNFGCFNDSGKINDTVLKTWSAILHKTPDSRLFLKSKTFSDQWVRNLFLNRAMFQGIAPHQIIFLGPSSYGEYLKDYDKVDIALDPFPYSGGATTADALSTGTPVLTCPFESFGSRLSSSVLHACDMDELVCENLNDYVSKAVRYANDTELLSTVTNRLRQTFPSSRLCDVDRFTKNFEQVILGVLN